jgi:NAD+ kinase
LQDPAVSANTSFQHIALIAKPGDTERLRPTLQSLEQFLLERKSSLSYDKRAAEVLGHNNALPVRQLAEQADLAIVIGGDGTLLHSARELVDAGIPLLGVNLGRLGFLVDISPDDMLQMVASVLDGEFEEDQRFLLSCTIGEQPPQLALNDVVLHKWNIARMIEFETWVNGSFIDTQRSDGMIISTPTGSTAYALSGGGPLLAPSLDAIAMVPICPHTLSNRPIVIHGNSEIQLVVCGKTHHEDVRVTCDGQASLTLQAGDKVSIAKHPVPLRLLHPIGHDHYQILRAKLDWGGKAADA